MAFLASAGHVGWNELGLPIERNFSGIILLSFMVEDKVERPKLLKVLLLSFFNFSNIESS
jgi:hypothetical protein